MPHRTRAFTSSSHARSAQARRLVMVRRTTRYARAAPRARRQRRQVRHGSAALWSCHWCSACEGGRRGAGAPLHAAALPPSPSAASSRRPCPVSFSAGGRALRDRVAVPVAPPGCRRRTRAAGHGAARRRSHQMVADDAATAAAAGGGPRSISRCGCPTRRRRRTACCGNLWLGS